ncbi:MAG: fumarylacetoacetate hydrolase family protein [Rhodospirillales bacterium]|nr:fumarylacetoacetate hydrolase family protein [Rhodospirillales bacterium]
MKLAYFDDFNLGVVKGDNVVDVSRAVADIPHTDPGNLMNGLIAQFDAYRARIAQAAADGKPVPLASVQLRPPLPRPGNIVCMAVNYMENGTLPAPPPINAFHKTANAVIGPGDTMVLPDVPAGIFEGEAEMALVIGKTASHVPATRAMDHVFGYVNFIDGSARGLPPPHNVFYQMKSRDTFAPVGPWIVTRDEIADPQSLSVRLWVNGVLRQDFSTSDMAHRIPRCIEWVSSIHRLDPGDLLATGTNHRGLSALQNGDQVDLETSELGRLSIRVRDDLARTWARTTRLEHREKGGEGPFTPQLSGKYAKAT